MQENGNVAKEAALALLKTNSAAAAAAIRAFADEESLTAPRVCRSAGMLHHPVRHNSHHLAWIKAVRAR